jgi:hypothetical protein
MMGVADRITAAANDRGPFVTVPPAGPGAVLPTPLPYLHRESTESLTAMLAAGHEWRVCQRALERGGLNAVSDLLRGMGTFYQTEHYPPDDVYDAQAGAQYYYHAHRGLPGEHGHFHTFLRAAGMPPDVAQPDPARHPCWPSGSQALAHLIAVSLDGYGRPIGLFAPNRWVTGDTWYSASEVARMLPRFRIDHAYPSWAVNRWLTALITLLRPHVEVLLEARDTVIAAWSAAHPGEDVLERRELEIAAFMPIDVDAAIVAVHDALHSRARPRRPRHGAG